MSEHSEKAVIAVNDVSMLTLQHYEQSAESFREGTWHHDVSQNIDALLRHIGVAAPARILDFGCGPGRDLSAFVELGHKPIGLDGSRPFVEMASKVSGCEVWHQDFLNLTLPDQYFDGVFANASLFHVPTAELPRVMRQLAASLKPSGVLFSSNPRGENQEGWQNGRYGVFHDITTWRNFVNAAGFVELEHYYRPAGLPHEQQRWLASVWRVKESVK
jgi:SAM-dependent methyltransferase